MSVWDANRAHVIANYEAHARIAGLGAVWDQAASEDNGTSTLMLGIIGAVAQYMVETRLALEPDPTP